MDLTAFYSQFRDETAENIRILNEGLLVLEALEPGAADRLWPGVQRSARKPLTARPVA